jgi:plasmid stabilization system protein ParE
LNPVYEVVVTRRAAAQIERAAAWWAENRAAAPGAIVDDFEEARTLLAIQPGIGSKSATGRYPELRRFYLERVRYHVYYEVRGSNVVVLAFWHGSRGHGPGP